MLNIVRYGTVPELEPSLTHDDSAARVWKEIVRNSEVHDTWSFSSLLSQLH
jgi:hypothetical protein